MKTLEKQRPTKITRITISRVQPQPDHRKLFLSTVVLAFIPIGIIPLLRMRPLAAGDIPHPEELVNPSQTMTNIDVTAIIQQWLTIWEVPMEYHAFWFNKVTIELVPDLQVMIYDTKTHSWTLKEVPAATYDGGNGTRLIQVRPEWLNKGIIAHEQAHNAYELLAQKQKDDWPITFITYKTNNNLIKYLFSIYPLSRWDAAVEYTEGHADLYRYLGNQMPSDLKKYYPKLM